MEADLSSIRFEAVLGVGGILMLIASFAPWDVVGSALGSWQGNAAFLGSWMVIFATMIRYRLLNLWELERFRPYTDGGLGGLGALLGLLGALTFPHITSLAWGLYLMVVASLISGFSAYMVFREYRRSGLPHSRRRELPKSIE